MPRRTHIETVEPYEAAAVRAGRADDDLVGLRVVRHEVLRFQVIENRDTVFQFVWPGGVPDVRPPMLRVADGDGWRDVGWVLAHHTDEPEFEQVQTWDDMPRRWMQTTARRHEFEVIAPDVARDRLPTVEQYRRSRDRVVFRPQGMREVGFAAARAAEQIREMGFDVARAAEQTRDRLDMAFQDRAYLAFVNEPAAPARRDQAAEERGWDFFRSILDDKQAAEFDRHGRVTVTGSHGGTYLVHVSDQGHNLIGNVERLDQTHRSRWCAHPPTRNTDGVVPLGDVFAGQVLAIRADEKAWRRIANRIR